MSFRPDSPLNRLVILWPGVPITMCALGFVLAVIEISQTHSGSFAALAIAMGCGLAFSVGLLFHSFFIEWIEVTITREMIMVRSVRSRPEGDVGYIRVTQFNEQTNDGLKKAISDLAAQISADKLKGYVIDLRNNPGGLLDQAISVSDAFLERGRIFFGLGLADLRFHAWIVKDTFPQLGHFFGHGYDGMFGLGDALGGLALAAQKPEAQAHTQGQKDKHAGSPSLHAAAETNQVIAQLENARLQGRRAVQRMIEMSVGLQAFPIDGL